MSMTYKVKSVIPSIVLLYYLSDHAKYTTIAVDPVKGTAGMRIGLIQSLSHFVCNNSVSSFVQCSNGAIL